MFGSLGKVNLVHGLSFGGEVEAFDSPMAPSLIFVHLSRRIDYRGTAITGCRFAVNLETLDV